MDLEKHSVTTVVCRSLLNLAGAKHDEEEKLDEKAVRSDSEVVIQSGQDDAE